MPRYDFRCESCSFEHELVFRMADKPQEVPCPSCGGRSHSLISEAIEVLVKDNQRPFKLDRTCLPIGWDKGNTDPEKQERRYKELVNSERSVARSVDKQAIKGGIRKVASVPPSFTVPGPTSMERTTGRTTRSRS